MSIALPSRSPGIVGWIVLPDTRLELKAKLAAERHARIQAERALEVALWQIERLEAALSDAHEHIDQLTAAWAKTIRPTTAARRAGPWAARGTLLADRIAGIFTARATQ